jgi:hypothetical protein
LLFILIQAAEEEEEEDHVNSEEEEDNEGNNEGYHIFISKLWHKYTHINLFPHYIHIYRVTTTAFPGLIEGGGGGCTSISKLAIQGIRAFSPQTEQTIEFYKVN